MAPDESTRAKVFRLREIPPHLDRQGLAELLCHFVPDGSPSDISIASLASTCDFWSSASKTATLTFHRLPKVVTATPSAQTWRLPVPGLPGPLILDDGFHGLTQLNDVPEDQHQHDCIVISGLASHPMGSWQPRGSDKSFMWIRDALPPLGIRFLLYGYDTALVGSKSFQKVDDLAMSLINAWKASGWTSTGGKPLIFLAHSLGGVVLKQMFVMLAGSGAVEVAMLAKTKGAIFFGVPSQGMRVPDMTTMLGEQPNKYALVKDLSDDSLFLPQLERQVSGISYVRRMHLFWCYETQTTPTLVQANGKYQRSGQETILVSKHSATGGRCDSDPTSTIQIDANHSDIAKLCPGNHLINVMADKLREIISNDAELDGAMAEPLNPAIGHGLSLPSYQSPSKIVDQFRDSWLDLEFWDKSQIAQSLRSPERDNRLHQIDPRAGKSFEWAFSEPSIGLTRWLQGGKGLFWVRGRPASGKSTMMKFLYNDNRTWQLVEGWRSKNPPIRASFFFHHRGNATQKSFDGLVRSILSQFLDDNQGTLNPLLPMFCGRYQDLLKASNQGSLKSDLAHIIEVAGIRDDSRLERMVADVLDCDSPLKKLREIVKIPMLSMEGTDTIWPLIEEAMSLTEPALQPPEDERNALRLLRNGSKPLRLEERLNAIEPPIYRLDWDGEQKSKLLSLIEDWREAMDLRKRLENLIALGDPELQRRIGGRADGLVERTVQRQRRRERLRRQVQSEEWSRTMLRRGLSLILEQQNTDLALFLFLDALDEYDGPTEIIANFIKDLVTDRPHSRTRIQILFSSRPWTVFLNAFGGCPGFEIHRHTENDIREFCAQMMQPTMPGFNELKRLIGDIVQRARGVFLWVKLLMYDLSGLAAQCIQSGKDTMTLRRELSQALNALPADLIEYYRAIVERISSSLRLETYCLLESLCRGEGPLFILQVPDMLACSTVSNFSQIRRLKDERTFKALYSHAERTEVETRLREISGGLVESVDSANNAQGVSQLQLLHQTMREFVEQPQFKHIVLGHLAHITADNGHTFLTKYMLCTDFKITVDCLRHAHRSEKTTGVGWYDFLGRESFPVPLEYDLYDQYFYPSAYNNTPHYFTAIEFSVAGMLHLTIKEALEQDGAAILQTSSRLLSIIMWSFSKGIYDIEEAIGMIEFLMSCGCEMDQSPTMNIQQDPAYIPDRFYKEIGAENFYRMAKAALGSRYDLDLASLPGTESPPLPGPSHNTYSSSSLRQVFGRLIGESWLWSERDDKL